MSSRLFALKESMVAVKNLAMDRPAKSIWERKVGVITRRLENLAEKETVSALGSKDAKRIARKGMLGFRARLWILVTSK